MHAHIYLALSNYTAHFVLRTKDVQKELSKAHDEEERLRLAHFACITSQAILNSAISVAMIEL